MEQIRKPFQGVLNIIRFNWHFYLIAAAFLILLLSGNYFLNQGYHLYANTLFFLISGTTFLSLAVSCYVYDFSGLYNFSWIESLHLQEGGKVVNIHAGFDETSALLKSKLEFGELIVLDFYDPLKHTEVSIKRARKSYPAYPGTIRVKTSDIPLPEYSVDVICAIFAAHEIRNHEERISFFRELIRIIKPEGHIIVTEHLRDMPNFLAYNIGFFHFYPRQVWYKTFEAAALKIKSERKHTPFITTFILEKNGDTF